MTTKICSVCRKEKDLSEFSRKRKDSDKLLSRCKECASIAYGKWRLKNLERRRKNKKGWYNNNVGHVKQYDKEHKDTDEYREIKKKCNKRYYEKNKNKICAYTYARRQKFGFNPLNNKFPGSVGHHIDRMNILYIPEELHKSIPHKQGEVSMNNINQASLEWYFTQNTIINRSNLEGDICGCLS